MIVLFDREIPLNGRTAFDREKPFKGWIPLYRSTPFDTMAGFIGQTPFAKLIPFDIMILRKTRILVFHLNLLTKLNPVCGCDLRGFATPFTAFNPLELKE